MKILYYHWIPFYDPWKEGGGIAVYLNNLIPYLCHNTRHQVSFLSSGYKSNPLIKKAYIKESRNPYSAIGCRSYELINSPIIAPSFYHTTNPLMDCEDNITSRLIVDFVRQQGGFDVIHFQSLEGIAPQTLQKLRQTFPKTRLIFSVHDYHVLCPGIRLFRPATHTRCTDFHCGHDCVNCIPEFEYKTYAAHIRRYCNDPYNKPAGIWLIRKWLKKISHRTNWNLCHARKGTPADYQQYRQTFVNLLNEYTDAILPVSRGTEKIMCQHGVNDTLMHTTYIGTKVAETALGHQKTPPATPLTFVFMGYASSPEKGFPFLVDTLEQLPPAVASHIRLIVAARGASGFDLPRRLEHLGEVVIYDGYTHDELSSILASAHVGIVPVLWDDNLPQVALELVAHGIPIISSDAGGPSELSTSPHFRFTCGNADDLRSKIQALVNNPALVEHFWQNYVPLKTMPQHVKELEAIYMNH